MPELSPTEVLRQHFGFTSFRGSQGSIIDHVLSGRHAMVVMPTGMGKSLCYQIPALLTDPTTRELVLVLSPLIALMQDQVARLTQLGIDAALINSSLNRETRITRHQEVANGKYRLLYVTPERFRKPEFWAALSKRKVKLLAIDEAHCVSQWGHDFRPDYSRIAGIRESLGQPTTIALTATATAECRDDIYRQLNLKPDQIKLFHEGIDRPNLALDVQEVWDDDDKLQGICDTLENEQYHGGSVIVYFSLIKTLDRFSDLLLRRGVDHQSYHGDLPRDRRKQIQIEFMNGGCDVVLATPAFGMGVDKEDIRIVMHAETPGSIESYYQEIGRAGRDGRPSLCRWFYAQSDLMTQMQFIDWANPNADFYNRCYTLLVEQNEQCRAFGLDWMNDRIQKIGRHDHRLLTVIGMLDRHGVIAGPDPPDCFHLIGALPDQLADDDFLNEKKRRDQQRLYAMVELANTTGDRKEFLNRYFLADSEAP